MHYRIVGFGVPHDLKTRRIGGCKSSSPIGYLNRGERQQESLGDQIALQGPDGVSQSHLHPSRFKR